MWVETEGKGPGSPYSDCPEKATASRELLVLQGLQRREERAWCYRNHQEQEARAGEALKLTWPGFKSGSTRNLYDLRASCSVGLSFICKKWGNSSYLQGSS